MVLTNHEDMGNTGKKTGWYLPEMAHPYHVFKKAGYSMTLASPKGGKAPLVKHVIFKYSSNQGCKKSETQLKIPRKIIWYTNLEQTPLNRCQQLPPPYKRLIHDRNETDKRTSNRPT